MILLLIFFRYQKILEANNERNLQYNASSSRYADFVDQKNKNEFDIQKKKRYDREIHANNSVKDMIGYKSYTILTNKHKNNDFHFEIQKSNKGTPIKEFLYIAEVTNNCTLPFKIYNAVKNIIMFYSSLQTPETDDILQSLQCVKSFQHLSDLKLHTRYLRTISLSEEIDLSRNKDYPYSAYSIYHEKGITGIGQEAAIADTGLDTKSCWFRDKSEVPFDTFSDKHRKIMSYLAYSDKYDESQGHGTIMAGIIAGQAMCQKSYCSGTFYDGIAPDSRLIIQDVIDEHGKLDFPANITELFEIPSIAKSVVQLNSWSYEYSPLLTRAVDLMAYLNMNLTIVFPFGEKNTLRSPADSKNVLTVGGYHQDTLIKSQEDEKPFFNVIIDGKKNVLGYCDMTVGISFLDAITHKKLSNDVCFKGLQIGVDKGDIFIDEFGDRNIDELNDAGLVIAFHNKEYKNTKLKTSLIRVKADERYKFRMGSRVTIEPIFTNNVSSESHNLPKNFFRTKPDIVYPSGPVYAPKAYSTTKKVCGKEGLLIAEGNSVSAALATGNILILSQWLREGYYPTGKKNKKNSIEPCSTLIRAILVNTADLPINVTKNDGGFGLPHLDKFMLFENSGSNQNGTKLFSNMSLKAGNSHKFVFRPEKNGKMRATLCWIEPDADIYKSTDILYTVDIRLVKGNGQVLIGNRKINEKFIDQHNTIKRIEIDVNAGEIYDIYIVSKQMHENCFIYYSLVISGPFDMFDDSSNAVSQEEANDTPCIDSCQEEEVCKHGFCVCPNNKDCMMDVDKLQTNSVYKKYISSNNMNYLALEVPFLNTESVINVNFTCKEKIHYIYAINRLPQWNDCDCTFFSCNFGEVYEDSFSINHQDFEFLRKGDRIVVGYYIPGHNKEGEIEISFEIK